MSFEHFTELISKVCNMPIEVITEDSSFRNDLGIDSLQMVNVLTHCSEVFEVGIEAFEDPEDMRTVGNLYMALKRGNKR